ncbi:DedA family protein [Candidatus Gracilibacteria bacterium]|nr:DedA family protein [Candidatus Gracilibacteria bacterium]
MHTLIDSLFSFFSTIDYIAIFILMTLESSIFPVPSELVMIPAGVSAMGGYIDPVLATLVGGVGSVVGALLNYFILGKWLGRPFLEKYGKYILITPEKYEKAEKIFLQNDKIYTFIGRLIPVVRHLISIPAGIFRMPLTPFVSITFAGATLWCAILVALGYYLGEPVIEVTKQYGKELTYIAIPAIGIYIWYKIFKK